MKLLNPQLKGLGSSFFSTCISRKVNVIARPRLDLSYNALYTTPISLVEEF